MKLAVLGGLLAGLVAALGGGLSQGVVAALGAAAGTALAVALGGWLLGGMAPALLEGLISGELPGRSYPGQRTRRSLWIALFSGVLVTSVLALPFGGLAWVSAQYLKVSPVVWASFPALAAMVGVASSIFNGGLFCFEHFLMRLMLWRSGCAPWDYLRFLDYAAHCLFLHRVGGGYIFVHRLLQEHFASKLGAGVS